MELSKISKYEQESNIFDAFPSFEPTVCELKQLIDGDELSIKDAVTLLLKNAHIKQDLNAFVTLDTGGALARAEELDKLRRQGISLGPLHGVPIVVKDNIHVAGLSNSAGTKALQNFVPERQGPVIEVLLNAGAIILGKNNMHELAYGITSNNAYFGPVGNAACSTQMAGGSSGGTAAAVAAGIAPAGLGTDTGGSVRIPAALNGLVGLRPTMSRYSQQEMTVVSTTRDTIGPMAKTIADVALLDGVITGGNTSVQPAELKGLRLGVPREYFYENLDPEVRGLIEKTLAALAREGVILVEADLPDIQSLNERVSMDIVMYETAQLLPHYLQSNNTGVSLKQLLAGIESPDVKSILGQVFSKPVSHDVYINALSVERPRLQQVFAHYFSENNVDAMIFPTTPLPARHIEGNEEFIELNGEAAATFPTYIRNTDPASNAGIPALTLPMGLTKDGLPLGLELDGPVGSDRRLLEIGLSLQKNCLNTSE